MRVVVSIVLLACPFVIAAGCFGGGGIDALPPTGEGGTGAAGGPAGSGGEGGSGGMGGAASTSSSSSSSSSASSSGSGGAPPNACPQAPDTPLMVELVSFGTKYCIDTTEVTNKQYKAWLDTKPSAESEEIQPLPECAFNTNLGSVGTPDNRPVANVDWCDAYAFCHAKGKRLCGAIGGGSTPYAVEYANPAVSQWHNACTRSGTREFPYEGQYVGAACNGADKGAGATLPVGSLGGCEGGFDEIFDMSGNVWEWEDSCDAQTGDSDKCRRRGGGYTSVSDDLDCSTASTNVARNATDSRTGFRCCADLP